MVNIHIKATSSISTNIKLVIKETQENKYDLQIILAFNVQNG